MAAAYLSGLRRDRSTMDPILCIKLELNPIFNWIKDFFGVRSVQVKIGSEFSVSHVLEKNLRECYKPNIMINDIFESIPSVSVYR